MYVLINIVSNQNIYVPRRIISQNCAAIVNPPPYILWGIIYKAYIEINYLAIQLLLCELYVNAINSVDFIADSYQRLPHDVFLT